jgi:hypothetical protein
MPSTVLTSSDSRQAAGFGLLSRCPAIAVKDPDAF